MDPRFGGVLLTPVTDAPQFSGPALLKCKIVLLYARIFLLLFYSLLMFQSYLIAKVCTEKLCQQSQRRRQHGSWNERRDTIRKKSRVYFTSRFEIAQIILQEFGAFASNLLYNKVCYGHTQIKSKTRCNVYYKNVLKIIEIY